MISEFADEEALMKSHQDWDWNEYKVIANAENIKTYINGSIAHDFYEYDGNIPLDGRIGLQRHGGGTFEVHYKDITIEELPTPQGCAPGQQWAKAARFLIKERYQKAGRQVPHSFARKGT